MTLDFFEEANIKQKPHYEYAPRSGQQGRRGHEGADLHLSQHRVCVTDTGEKTTAPSTSIATANGIQASKWR